jgi:hypothetical protein
MRSNGLVLGICAVLALGTSPAAFAALPPGAALVVDRDGVQVHELPLPAGASSKSAAVALLASAVVDAPPDDLLDLLVDYEWRQKYLPELVENRLLARGDQWKLLYHRVKPPILSERDYTLRVTWGKSGSIRWSRFQLANERGPAARGGVVRIPKHEGTRSLQPLGRGTRIEYRLAIDFSGRVPGWLLRSRIAKSIPDLFQAIRREARLRRK